MNVYEYLPFFFTFLHAFWCWWARTHTHTDARTLVDGGTTHTAALTHTYAAYLFFLVFFFSFSKTCFASFFALVYMACSCSSNVVGIFHL